MLDVKSSKGTVLLGATFINVELSVGCTVVNADRNGYSVAASLMKGHNSSLPSVVGQLWTAV